MELMTVGHGTLDADGFAALVTGAGVSALVDVRRYPGSRRYPHFSSDAMAEWLPGAGVPYRWEPALGGRRPVAPDSPDVALRNAGFRGYAGWMRTDEFTAALDAVLRDAAERRTAVCCAESLWWRCHRRMIADAAVLLHDVAVSHLLHDGRLATHAPTDGVRVAGDVLVYDAGTLPLT